MTDYSDSPEPYIVEFNSAGEQLNERFFHPGQKNRRIKFETCDFISYYISSNNDMTEPVTSRGLKILREEGVRSFLSKAVRYVTCPAYQLIRPHLPTSGYETWNSVKVNQKKLAEDWFCIINRPTYEAGVISAHEELTEVGDSIIIIGGGKGISAVRASQIVGKTGQVDVFEGGEESVQKMRQVLDANEVENISHIHHSIVGQGRSVYGGNSDRAEITPPSELPECDVLELDCEGAEIDILNDLEVRPRVIIVELHPPLYSEPPEYPIELLEGMGYEIKYQTGHDGIDISDSELSMLLEKHRNRSANWGDRWFLESGARWPVVIGAVRED